MPDKPPAFTIVCAERPGRSKTIKTGLSESEARDWLQRKASQNGGRISADLVLTAPNGETWSAVKAE